MNKGFTLVELIVVIGILALLVVAVLTLVNPSEAQKKTRDLKRLNDAKALETIIEQAIADNNIPTNCNAENVGCTSEGTISAPFINCNSPQNWIDKASPATLANYCKILPVDPLNNATAGFVGDGGTAAPLFYRVRIVGADYEINVRMESSSNTTKVQRDGGNSNAWFEIGSDLVLMGD